MTLNAMWSFQRGRLNRSRHNDLQSTPCSQWQTPRGKEADSFRLNSARFLCAQLPSKPPVEPGSRIGSGLAVKAALGVFSMLFSAWHQRRHFASF
jgi:hypothetical protein